MKQARFLLRVAAVASSMLLVTGFVSFRAGVLNRFLSSPAHAGVSYEDTLQDVVFDLNSLAFLGEFDEPLQPFVIAPKTRTESTNAAGPTDLAFELHPNTPPVQTATNQSSTLMAGSKSLVGIVTWPAANGRPETTSTSARLNTFSQIMPGSKSTVIDWKAPAVSFGPVITSGSGSEVSDQRKPTMMLGSKSMVVEWKVPNVNNTTGTDSMLIPLLSQQKPADASTLSLNAPTRKYYDTFIRQSDTFVGQSKTFAAESDDQPAPATASKSKGAALPKSKSTVTDLQPLTMPSQEVMSGSKSIVIGWGTKSLLFPPNTHVPLPESSISPLTPPLLFIPPKSSDSITYGK